ncbi:MAG: sigma-70 family RNA polymerase sigma factor [Verrucomicrobiaceae bacterium]|nr:sigma-70 family RNA polymerase sigma factor [Verrucomicrobiaceae bacterium]
MIEHTDESLKPQPVVQVAAVHRTAGSRGGPRADDVDPVRSYLAQITRIRRVTREEEGEIVARLEAAERRLDAVLGGMGFAFAHYASIGEDIIGGRARMDRFVMERHVPDREAFPRRLEWLCAELKKGIDQCERCHAELTRADDDAWAEAGARFEAVLGHVRALLPSFCFKRRVNADFVALLPGLLDELASIEARLHDGHDSSAAAAELREFERRAWMSARMFRERAAEARQADADCAAAKQALVEAHLWLSVLLARNYNCPSMTFLDLVQEGNMGLMRAVEMYDSDAGSRFGNYASWWIRQAITRGIAEQARLIRLPVYLSATAGTILRVQRELAMDFGQDPSVEDIAEEMKMPPERVRSILATLQPPLSLQIKVGDGNDAPELGDMIEDPRSAPPDDSAAVNALGDRLDEVLATLTEQERLVMSSRYGLADSTSRSMREVGRQVNLCPQRIQQIEAKALKKLRHPVRIRMLNRLLGRDLS